MIHWLAMVPWIVLVLVLLWRVIRLEQRAGRNEAQATWLHECIMHRAHKESVDALSQRVAGDLHRSNALARALGYEWKRTEAKEGWEKRKEPFGFGIGDYDAYKKALERSINVPPIWVQAGPATRVGDRRKADRRKPTPQAPPKSPPKKPRRAH